MSALEAVKLLWGGRNVSLQFKTTTTKKQRQRQKKIPVCRQENNDLSQREDKMTFFLLVTLLRKAINVK